MKISDKVMLHSVHILFGEKYAQFCKDLRSYVVKYGDDDVNRYFTPVVCTEGEGKLSFRAATIAEEDRKVFSPGIERMFSADFIEKPKVMPVDREYIRQYFADLFSDRVVNVGPGEDNRLSVCLYVPLDDEAIWERARSIIESTEDLREHIIIDVFLISHDLLHVFDEKTQEGQDADEDQQVVLRISDRQRELAKKLIREIVGFKSQHWEKFANIVLMQNYNSQGYSLKLDYDGFVRIAGEYALMTMVAYNDIFHPNMRNDGKPLKALGLSVLSLDRYDYVQFMLHRAYLYIMDREKVMQGDVPVNKLSLIVQAKLADKVHIFSRLYDEKVWPMINEHKSHEVIAAEIDSLVVAEIAELTDSLQADIYKDELSLPEKRAALALLLGEDDSLLSGQLFNKDLLEMDDCSVEVMDFLIKANNSLLAQLSSDVPAPAFPEHLNLSDYAALSERSAEPVALALKDLKKLKTDIRRDTEYIRKRQSELERIEANIQNIQEETKVLKDGGFEYGNTIFKVVEEIEQRPFEQTYMPLASLGGVTSADLRSSFTSIKSQGPVGACASFAFTSVYEYILNKNGKLTESDLSERFLYYYTRKRMGTLDSDSGTNMYDAGKTLETEGICSEELCPYSYDFEEHKVQPSAQADTDGQTRRVAEIKNVNIKEDDIKSALVEGYPVIISLHLHESFNKIGTDGFVRCPDESDPAVGWHAMVIVGFSDKDRVFIVRNSWGIDFGDKGYCYVPYSYVLDTKLNSICCIITKISSSDIEVKGNSNKISVQFDESNSRILSALLRIKIDYTKQLVAQKTSLYNRLYLEHATLIETAKVASNRALIEDGTQKRLEWEKAELVKEEQKLRDERLEAIETCKRSTLAGHITFASVFVIVALIYALLFKFKDGLGELFDCPAPVLKIMFNKVSYWIYGILAFIALIWTAFWTPYRRQCLKKLKMEWDDMIEDVAHKINDRKCQLEQLRLRFHLAGGIIEMLTTLKQNLSDKYHSMRSFSENLVVWHNEEAGKMSHVASVRNPFISILNSECLNKYFEEEAGRITEGLRLHSLFKDSYAVSDEAIIAFKYKLKDAVVELLFDSLRDFTVYKYISGEQDYPYLDKERQGISELLKTMDFKSEPFIRMKHIVVKSDSDNDFSKLIFLKADIPSARDKWERLIAANFMDAPVLYEAISPFKMTLIQIRGLDPDGTYDF